MNTRYLDWPDLANARDLGGMHTADGRMTCFGTLVRTDSPHNLTDAGFAQLRDYGVGTVIDLRTFGELERLPNPLARRAELDFHHVSLLGRNGDAQFERDIGLAPHAEWVTMMLELAQARIADVMRAIAAAPATDVVLFHCHVGKDRTGLIADMLLGLAGVPDAVIADEYVLSNARLLSYRNPHYAGQADDASRERMANEVRVHRETALAALETMRALGGDVRGYLQRIGLTVAQIERIATRVAGNPR
jgi:protein-tyrosine phosphatase